MLRLFKKNIRFEFDVNIDTRPFGSDLSLAQISIIKKYHRKQKRTIEKYASEVANKCKHDFRDNIKKIKTSCLELCVLYHHFFSNEFDKIKADAAVSRLYFSTIYHNFSDLEERLHELDYANMADFIRVKKNYYKEVHDRGSRLELSHYYYHTFAKFPLMQPENYKTLPPFFDYIDSWLNYIFFLDFTARIRMEAEEMSKAMAVLRPAHVFSHAHA
ncbi:MAG: hypothetical protein RB294_08000 [Bacteroidales bacterium]|jgi:hypothetical protein|nr:hypothetical protein [Bacteroidales bacterium]